MAILITRNSGWMGTASRIRIDINDQPAAKISQGETIQLPLFQPVVSMQVKQFGMKSNRLEVFDGDRIVIKGNPVLTVLFIVFLLAASLVTALTQMYWLSLIILLVYTVLFYLLDLFKLEKY